MDSPTLEPEKTAMLPDLDLKEANVLDVAFNALGEGKYRFDVTLTHDDQGESPSFADRWVVEDLAGNVLGERTLLHAHGNEPFTRSETVLIPESVSVVLIRGHDAIHGFGGQAIQLDLNDGSKIVVLDRPGY